MARKGLATYVESIARAQAGELGVEQVWAGFVKGMPNGLPQSGDRGLDHTHTWGRTYWGGRCSACSRISKSGAARRIATDFRTRSARSSTRATWKRNPGSSHARSRRSRGRVPVLAGCPTDEGPARVDGPRRALAEARHRARGPRSAPCRGRSGTALRRAITQPPG